MHSQHVSVVAYVVLFGIVYFILTQIHVGLIWLLFTNDCIQYTQTFIIVIKFIQTRMFYISP